ncbi:MAG TPA: fibronectin type III domain-containing protein, partial [Syntrophomonadaceae bacterium]|nr:fibronectin type III domain-containing protein [Syntrophomonadaceae bacterium]
ISNPKVTAVINATDPTETTRIRSISVEGGQEIKLKGIGFMEGLKVIFMPVTNEAGSDTSGNIIYRVGTKQEEYSGRQFTSNVIVNHLLESGVEGSDVKFIDNETLTVKVPAGKLDSKGIIVVNPDQGASDSFDDITYGLPGLDTPLGVTAELMHDKYNNTDTGIKVNWTEVKGATEYELYVVADNQMELIGSTKLLAYIHEDLKPRTSYKFIVKAVGDFGSSKPSAESNRVRTGRTVGVPDFDGGIIEHTLQEKKGNTAHVSLGTTENRSNLLVDLTRGNLAGSKEIVLSIPARVISNNRNMIIDIKGADFAMKLTPGIFNNAKAQQNRHKDEAGVRFTVAPVTKNTNSSANGLSQVYEVKADFYEGKANSSIDYLATNMSLVLDYDVMKANMRKFRNVSISRYDQHSNRWQALKKDNYLSGSTSTIINRMGNYVVMGGRN